MKMDAMNISFLTGVGCGLCIGVPLVAYRKVLPVFKAIKQFTTNGEYRLALIVRTDLNMTKGKIASQCGHAAISSYQEALIKDPDSLNTWLNLGQTKIALKSRSLEEIFEIKRNAEQLGLVTSIVRDAGRTQVDQNSVTVLAVGPAPKSLVDKVTGHLKLL